MNENLDKAVEQIPADKKYESLINLIPSSGESSIDWDGIMQSELQPYLQKMSETPQNPEWHGEGDVLTHTKMVCERLIQLRAWKNLDRRNKRALFLAALLHDIGKTVCTRLENSVYVSPNHTSIGDRMVRALLWRDLGVGGTVENQRFRETVCALIRHHSKPFHFLDVLAPERMVIELSSIGTLAPDFTNELLSMLAEADIRGRIATDTDERLEYVTCFREVSAEHGCFNKPYPFLSSFSRYAYLSGRNIVPWQDLYDDTWGTVIMLSGLPGTGKDTFIGHKYPSWPKVSLDTLRKEMHISPTKPQGAVASAALEQAKAYLRKRQPFVWNATNITPQTRKKLVDIFSAYKASVKVVFLETSWDEMLNRNQNRRDVVPEAAIERMLEKTVPPNLSEAHEVEWVIL